jgi:hypothetical protein
VKKTNLMLNEYKGSCEYFKKQNYFTIALEYAEKVYNCAAESYNPAHPEVSIIASLLIDCLVHEGNM